MIRFRKLRTVLFSVALFMTGCLLAVPLNGENMVFPDDAGLVDVTKPPYNAKGDGRTDNTAAVQKAIDDYRGKNYTLYFPDGTYLFSDQVGLFNAKPHSSSRFVHIQGQSEEGTVLKLKDNAGGFDDPDNTKVFISLYKGKSTGDAMHTMAQNVTVDAGAGNPGVAAFRYLANNSGSVYNVTIRSSDPDGAGAIGLDLRQSQQGPALVKHVTVDGFDRGVQLGNSFHMVFEHLTLRNQREVGFYNPRARVTMRDLTSTNAVPAVKNLNHADLTLVEADLSGGASDETAIFSENREIFLRDVRVSGYAHSVKDSKGNLVDGDLKEGYEGKGYAPFGCKKTTLRLPVKETPDIPWETDRSNWVKVESDGDDDDSEALQDAIDEAAEEGKTTIYFPRKGKRNYIISKPIRVHGSVNRIIGMENILWIDGSGELDVGSDVFLFEDLDGPLVVERFFNFLKHGDWKGFREEGKQRYLFRNKSDQPIVLKNFAHGACRLKKPQPGKTWFLEDVVGPMRVGKNEKIWARQFNPESPRRPMTVVDGGQLWILGMKTEGRATHIHAKNGARVELLGGVSYQSWKNQPLDPPMFIVDGPSEASFTFGFYHYNQPFTTIVKETAGKRTEQLKRKKLDQYHLPLYRACEK